MLLWRIESWVGEEILRLGIDYSLFNLLADRLNLSKRKYQALIPSKRSHLVAWPLDHHFWSHPRLSEGIVFVANSTLVYVHGINKWYI